jgi:hypothetical protein
MGVLRRNEKELNPEFEGCLDTSLIQELEVRGYIVVSKDDDIKPLVEKIYHLRRITLDYQKELEELIYKVIGRN